METISERKFAWSIVALYIVLIFLMLGDVVLMMDIAERKLGQNLDIMLSYLPYLFIAFILFYLVFIKREKRLSYYFFLVIIILCIFFVVKFLDSDPTRIYPVEKVHLVEYGILGALSFWAVSLHRFGLIASYVLVFLIALIVGSIDEIVQHFLPLRYFDIRDIFVNFNSGVLGAVIYGGVLMEGDESVNT